MQIIFYAVIIPAALAWCAYLAFDTVRICRKGGSRVEKLKSEKHLNLSTSQLFNFPLEARQ